MNIRVKGGQTLSGELTPSGSKNSVVALIPATLLFNSTVELHNVPEITDVVRLVKIMTKLGSRIEWDKEGKTMKLDNSSIRSTDLDKEDLGNMKGTSLLWGPMLARFRSVDFKDLPGGCTLGSRPLGPQYDAFRALGVKVQDGQGSAQMDATSAEARDVWLPEMSPTITENMLMLAVSLPGKTRLVGAASEPQVQDLCEFLIEAGADITGVGSSILEIEGGALEKLTPKVHKIWADHYEIATFLAMAAITGGSLKIHDALPEQFPHINYVFSKFGVDIHYEGKTAFIEADQKIAIKSEQNAPLIVRAQPWPSLPVDLLPIFIPLGLAAHQGQVLYHNWMYESGLFWTSELTKLGANIIMADPHRVIVNSGCKLTGAELEAPYIIRAVVAMVMAAMIAEGESTILNADALYRGHPHFSDNLKRLGIIIEELM
jgi:UDP-N-acetylglucosamine 1-carboxyvinyltransferase